MQILKYFFAAVLININVMSQSISIEVHDTLLYNMLGSEMIFSVDVTNISGAEQIIYLVRTQNQIPDEWSSSLCFDACFADWIDSIVTSPDFNSSPLQPGETREVSVHVFPLVNTGEGHVQVKIGCMRDTEFFLADFTAVVNPVSVNNKLVEPGDYHLFQNYPNPFNPSTEITFRLKSKGQVIINVYNSIGQMIKTLVKDVMDEGLYSINFHAEDLNTGIYFYRITTPGFSSTKKMILLR